MVREVAPVNVREVDPSASDTTISFYDRSPQEYADATLTRDLTSLYPELLDRVPEGGLILDAGSGAGRDIRAFLQRGFRVEAFDASAGLAALATRLTGIRVDVRRFEDWDAPVARYDGVWCFASLLHVRRADLPIVLRKLARALKPAGWLFASFKGGSSDTIDLSGRHFTNLTEDEAQSLFEGGGDLDVTKIWHESGPTALGDTTTWIYILAQRTI